MNVLVIAPHPDDESIGCGGTICVHADRGDRVVVVFLTSGELGLTELTKEQACHVRECEAEEAAAILGVTSVEFLRQPDQGLGANVANAAKLLQPILQRELPEVIYLTHERDFHTDHRATVRIVQMALRNVPIPPPDLLSYEVLTPFTEFDRAEDVARMMPRKLRAICAHRSQVRQFRYDRAARALSAYRGTLARVGPYAEVFQVADGRLDGVPHALRADPSWHRVYNVARNIEKLIPAEDAFILVDDGNLDVAPLVSPRRCIPVLEKDGGYWGKPANDAIAISELERLRKSGARFIAFAWPALWWLDHYSGLRDYLRSQFDCLAANENLVLFDLSRAPRNNVQRKVA